jgi:hypothetical protein
MLPYFHQWVFSSCKSHFLTYFPKVSLCDIHPVRAFVNPPHQRLNAWINYYEAWYVYQGSWTHHNGVLHKSLPSVCVWMYIPPVFARQRLGEHFPAATNRRNNGRIVGSIIFCADRVLSKKSMLVSVCILLSLLGNGSVKTFPRQRIHTQQYKNCWTRLFVCDPCRIEGK